MSWNKKHNQVAPSAQKPKYLDKYAKLAILAILGCVICIGVGVAVMKNWQKTESSSAQKQQKKPKTNGKQPKTNTNKPPTKAHAVLVETNTNNAAKAVPNQHTDTLLSSVTNSSGRVVERFRMADGTTYKVRRWAKPPLFRYATDDVLSMLLTQRSSGPIPPIPYTDNMDKLFLESLKEPIIIDKNASPEIQERQRVVREARMEVKALMDQGLTFREIAAEHEQLMNKNAAIRAEAIEALKKERDKGDSEGTKEFLDKINKALEDMDIEPISMPRDPKH